MAKLLGDSKGPIEGLRDFHGERPEERRTNGNADRSYALELVNAYRLDMLAFRIKATDLPDLVQRGFTRPDGSALQVGDPDPDFQLPELEDLHDHLAGTWASHQGWDTTQSIELVKAGTSLRQNHLAFPEGEAPKP